MPRHPCPTLIEEEAKEQTDEIRRHGRNREDAAKVRVLGGTGRHSITLCGRLTAIGRSWTRVNLALRSKVPILLQQVDE